MSIYDEIGLPRVINAAGSMTYLGGSLMHPEVLEAMRSAAGSYVFIEDLLKWASDEIAAHTGAEAGLVTTGTTGGLILATAACLTGTDHQRVELQFGRRVGRGRRRGVVLHVRSPRVGKEG